MVALVVWLCRLRIALYIVYLLFSIVVTATSHLSHSISDWASLYMIWKPVCTAVLVTSQVIPAPPFPSTPSLEYYTYVLISKGFQTGLHLFHNILMHTQINLQHLAGSSHTRNYIIWTNQQKIEQWCNYHPSPSLSPHSPITWRTVAKVGKHPTFCSSPVREMSSYQVYLTITSSNKSGW